MQHVATLQRCNNALTPSRNALQHQAADRVLLWLPLCRLRWRRKLTKFNASQNFSSPGFFFVNVGRGTIGNSRGLAGEREGKSEGGRGVAAVALRRRKRKAQTMLKIA